MKSQVKKLDKLKRILEVEVGAEKIREDKNNVYKELARSFKIPGFRPGNAPLEMVEKHHKKILDEEFLKKMVPSYYSKALEENGLVPVGMPRIYNVNFDAELSFSAEFEVKPDIQLKDEDYKNIKIKAKEVKVEEIEIDKIITQLKDNIKKIVKKDYSDDEIAKWAGYPSKSLLRDAIRTEILLDKMRSYRRNVENSVIEELTRRIKTEVPQTLVNQQQERLFEEEITNLRTRGVKEEDIKKYENDIRDKMKSISQKQVKLYYILEAIAKKESLSVDEDNLTESVMGFVLSCAQYIA